MSGWRWSNPPNTQFRLNKDSPQAKGLIAWIPGLSGVLYDFVYGIRGTISGTSTWTATQKFGEVFSPNAGTCWGQFPHRSELNLVGDGSVSAWIYLRSSTGYDGIVHKGNDNSFTDESWSFQTDNTNHISLYLGSQNFVANSFTLPLLEWVYVGFVWNTTTITAYINDSSQSVARTQSPFTYTGPMMIGTQTVDYSRLDGMIADIRIKNYAISAAESLDQYRNLWDLYEPVISQWVIPFVATPPPVTGWGALLSDKRNRMVA